MTKKLTSRFKRTRNSLVSFPLLSDFPSLPVVEREARGQWGWVVEQAIVLGCVLMLALSLFVSAYGVFFGSGLQ